jgi:putative ABC transport system ATP-binding protein
VTPLIQTESLCKDYRMGLNVVHALRGVDIEVREGEFLSIMGPSGSGKSTFMNIIGCLDRPTEGSYYLAGAPVSGLGDNRLAEVRNQQIGFVFQTFNLLARTTALRNVELPLIYAGARHRTRKAKEALEMVGLEDRMEHRSNELSGGQQQRVAIARAIVNDPKIILGDEPTGNLDTRTGAEIMVIFQELHRRGKTVVIITHEPDVARFTERIVRFRDGKIVGDEPVESPTDARQILEELGPAEE